MLAHWLFLDLSIMDFMLLGLCGCNKMLCKFLKDKDTLKQEILVAKEAMELARNKFGPMEDENRRLQDEIDKVREVKQIVIYYNEQLHIDSQ